MDDELPPELAKGAEVRGSEYGWQLSSFPDVIAKAATLGYACLGGQFQFRLDDGTCEMYWLSADSEARIQGETWAKYCARSCSEILTGFEKLALETDFRKEGMAWPSVQEATTRGQDPLSNLVFVAYFVDEGEWARL
jgi:hypothetical protein